MNKSPYEWDKYSDQPHIIRDKKFKRILYKRGAWASIKTFLLSFLLPFFAVSALFQRRTVMGGSTDKIGLCVNVDYPLDEKKHPSNEQLLAMVDELGVKNILVRIPLADMNNVEKYYSLIECFVGKNLLIHILQDRAHIEDAALTQQHFREIFSRLQHMTCDFQIGNSINRRKWGFISQDEYCHFFKIAQDLKEKEFSQLQLIGGNIIDFELPPFLRSLFHLSAIKYDGVAAQLYVDRRGAPENMQMGCDTIAKINWFSRIMLASPKTKNRLLISEVNWPLEGTLPYAPAYGECMVSEALQATYLVRYYLLMIASGKVDMCYWHQLVAPGYGLVDNLGTDLRKRDAYTSLKVLNALLGGGTTAAFTEKDQRYSLQVKTDKGTVQAVWGNRGAFPVTVNEGCDVINLLGERVDVDARGQVQASEQVVYILGFKHEFGRTLSYL